MKHVPSHVTLLKLAAVLATGLTVQHASAQVLSTLAPNNGSGGVFFDLSATGGTDLSWTGFATYFGGAVGSTAAIEVWTRPGTFSGFQGAAAGWTLVDTVSGLSAGTTALSGNIMLTTPLDIGAASTLGVYLQSTTAGNGLRYQGTGTTATTLFSNADITLTGGSARTGAIAFGGTLFSPRVFSGDILYTAAVPEPATYGLMALGLLGLLGARRLGRGKS